MKSIGRVLGAVAIVALLLFGYQRYGAWQTAQLVKWRADSARVADATRDAERTAAQATIRYDTTRLTYTRYRDRVVASGTATSRDSVTFAKCDAIVATCEERHAADSAVAAALRAELAIARVRPSEKPKRVTLYGDGLYDVLHATPVFRAGVELRLFGGIHVTAVGDLAIPPAGETRVQARTLVGIRYVF